MNDKFKRAYYIAKYDEFISLSDEEILGNLVDGHMPYTLTVQQEIAWKEEIIILKKTMQKLGTGYVAFEYEIPRMGKRVDAVIILEKQIFLLEFKIFEKTYHKQALDQVVDYALDLHNFHQKSENIDLFPVVVCTDAPDVDNTLSLTNGVSTPICCNQNNLLIQLKHVIKNFQSGARIDAIEWINSKYYPTPTIIEAAQALYRNHSVSEIMRNDADDLTITSTTIKKIIYKTKGRKRKAIIFVTGVPGAGKTLVGLNLANELHNNEKGEHAVFLSGNHPLVSVLNEALIRDKIMTEKEKGCKINKKDAKREIGALIQMIYYFRDEHYGNDTIPVEKIAIFDEAQRAWTQKEMCSFMKKNNKIKFGDQAKRDEQYSEPGFLISTMDRHQDWAVIICLVGGGQEINRGEAGISEWFKSLQKNFKHWDVYVTDKIKNKEYIKDYSWKDLVAGLNFFTCNSLHLSASMRTFRSEKVSDFIEKLLDNNILEASQLYKEIIINYPIYITRDLIKAKEWVKGISRGNERYGLFASSGAARLKPRGVVYSRDSISPEHWFLNAKNDVRSSYFLEVVASEFETQGLELDYAIVAWDADLRIEDGKWKHYQFSTRMSPPNWSPIRNQEDIRYLTNAYRVLLTRARQGFIIYIPKGVEDDKTRSPKCYDETYFYLKSIGIMEL